MAADSARKPRRHLIAVVLGFACRLAFAVALLAVASAATAQGQDPDRRPSVLMLFVTRASVAVSEQRAFEQALVEQLGSPVEFHVEYLELPYREDPGYRQRTGGLPDREVLHPSDRPRPRPAAGDPVVPGRDTARGS